MPFPMDGNVTALIDSLHITAKEKGNVRAAARVLLDALAESGLIPEPDYVEKVIDKKYAIYIHFYAKYNGCVLLYKIKSCGLQDLTIACETSFSWSGMAYGEKRDCTINWEAEKLDRLRQNKEQVTPSTTTILL